MAKKRPLRLILLALCALHLGCSPGTTTPKQPTDTPNTLQKTTSEIQNAYAPFSVGNRWEYRMSTGGTFTREVVEVQDGPDGSLIKSIAIEPDHHSVSWHRFDNEGRLYRVKTTNSNDGVFYTFEPPYIATGIVKEGNSWRNHFQSVRHEPGSDKAEVLKEVDYEVKVQKKERVKVPAGEFDAFLITSELMEDREWVAEGVGMVKYEVIVEGELVTYELVEYHIE